MEYCLSLAEVRFFTVVYKRSPTPYIRHGNEVLTVRAQGKRADYSRGQCSLVFTIFGIYHPTHVSPSLSPYWRANPMGFPTCVVFLLPWDVEAKKDQAGTLQKHSLI